AGPGWGLVGAGECKKGQHEAGPVSQVAAHEHPLAASLLPFRRGFGLFRWWPTRLGAARRFALRLQRLSHFSEDAIALVGADQPAPDSIANELLGILEREFTNPRRAPN